MKDLIDIARAERENLRWIILSALWRAEPYGTNEHVLLRTAQDMPLRITPDQLRRELSYVAGLGLITLNVSNPLWSAKITPSGSDVVDYRADCPAGIARPPQW